MDRRALLKILAATAISGCNSQNDQLFGRKIVVAGAGIIGASIAYHLAKSGASVTVIDKQGPASNASRGSFAWINATWAKQPQAYHALSKASVAYWHDVQQALDLPVRWGGSLEWFEGADRQALLVQQIAEQVDWGEPARMIDAAEFSRLEPNIIFGKKSLAAFSPNDGAVDPIIATRKLLKAATALGATVLYPCELQDVTLNNGRLSGVATSTGPIDADKLVLATGAAPGMAKAIAAIDIPQRSRPGIIAITEPMPALLQHVISAPGVHMHQRGDGRIVIGEQAGAPKNEAHALRLQGRPNDFPGPEIAQEHAARMLAIARRFVPGIESAKIDSVFIGWRPLPIDGHPVIGPSPNRPDVYIAIMHSGVTLAPIVGQLAAQELMDGTAANSLHNYRPDRVFTEIHRY